MLSRCSALWRLFTDKKPSNAYREVDKPDNIKAFIPATGPGTEVTVMSFSIHSLTKSSPGSDIAGVPAISVPCGRDDSNMPIGAQLIGPAFSEKMLYRVAAVLEEVSKQ